MMSTETPPSAGRSAIRRGEGDASAAAASGRMSHSHVSVNWAARLSRRRDSARTFDCHNMTAPQLPFLRICSAAHNASAELPGRNHSTLRSFTCQERQAIACGRYGGCIRATRCCLDSDTRVGFSNCISPMPCCWTSSSTRADLGHPPLGSSASSALWPVVQVVEREIASSLARHTSRMAGSPASSAAVVVVNGDACMLVPWSCEKYCMDAQYML